MKEDETKRRLSEPHEAELGSALKSALSAGAEGRNPWIVKFADEMRKFSKVKDYKAEKRLFNTLVAAIRKFEKKSSRCGRVRSSLRKVKKRLVRCRTRKARATITTALSISSRKGKRGRRHDRKRRTRRRRHDKLAAHVRPLFERFESLQHVHRLISAASSTTAYHKRWKDVREYVFPSGSGRVSSSQPLRFCISTHTVPQTDPQSLSARILGMASPTFPGMISAAQLPNNP